MENNKWILTDDDSYQHVKKIKENIYKLIQVQEFDTGYYKVYCGIIDVKFYIEKDKEKVNQVIAYYYGDDETTDSIQEIFNSFGEEKGNQYIAEMLFEDDIFEMTSLFHGNWEDCQEFVDNYIENKKED